MFLLTIDMSTIFKKIKNVQFINNCYRKSTLEPQNVKFSATQVEIHKRL